MTYASSDFPITNEDVDHIFKIDNAPGKLTPLERPQFGQHTTSLQYTDAVWLKGSASPMAIRADDQPLRLAIRFGYITKAWDKEMEDCRKKPLVVQEMKVQRDTRQQETGRNVRDLRVDGPFAARTRRAQHPLSELRSVGPIRW